MNLIYFVLIAHGLTQILIYGKIFDKVRPQRGWLGDLFVCPMCVGFHVGWILWLFRDNTGLFSFDNNLETAFLLSCLSSGTSYILSMLFGDCGLKVNFSGDKNETTD